MYNKRVVGTLAEEKVSEYLANQGLVILTQNYRTPYGEMDIIALDRDTIVFIEVKARKNEKYGLGREAVNKAKQLRYHNSALYFLQTNAYKDKPIRFDVVELAGANMTIEHLQNAF